jgi:hypothetical protein
LIAVAELTQYGERHEERGTPGKLVIAYFGCKYSANDDRHDTSPPEEDDPLPTQDGHSAP